LILDSLIEDLKDEAYIRKKLSLGNKIFYENKTRGILAKKNKKDKKNKKAKCFYYLQENPRHNPSIYFKTNIKKQKK
jgi:carboxypeptidase C (cathepsin A)